MWEILGGLLGTAVGVGLYLLGRHTARRGVKVSKAVSAEGPTMASMTPQEWYNFLNYDGGEQTKESD